MPTNYSYGGGYRPPTNQGNRRFGQPLQASQQRVAARPPMQIGAQSPGMMSGLGGGSPAIMSRYSGGQTPQAMGQTQAQMPQYGSVQNRLDSERQFQFSNPTAEDMSRGTGVMSQYGGGQPPQSQSGMMPSFGGGGAPRNQGGTIGNPWGGQGLGGGQQPQNSGDPSNRFQWDNSPFTQGGAYQQDPNNPFAFNPQMQNQRYSAPVRSSFELMRDLPGSGEMYGNLRDPSQLYSGITPQAQQFLGGLPQSMQNNPWSGQANDLQNYGMGMLGQGGMPQAPQMGQLPQAPNMQMAGQYRQPQFQQPQFGQAQGPQMNSVSPQFDQLGGQRFDPSGVQGPNTNQQFGQPSTGVPGFQDIMRMSQQMGTGVGNVPREQIGGSGFQNNQLFGNPNSIANQAFGSALGGAQAQQGAGLNDSIYKQNESAILNSLKQADAIAGLGAQENVGSRGFAGVPGTNIYDSEKYRQLAPVLAQTQEKLMGLGERNLDRTIQQNQFGTSQASGLGSAASNAAQGNAGLLQGENQFLGGSQIQQRGQDIDLARMGQAGQQSNLSALTGLAGTLGGLGVNAYEAGTQRGLGQGNLGLGGYEAQTGRMGTMGNIANQQGQQDADWYRAATDRGLGMGNLGNQGNQNMIDAYRAQTGQFGAETDRGLGAGNLGLNQQQLGFDYNQLNSQNALGNAGNQIDMYGAQSGAQNQYNQNAIDLYGQQGQIGGQYQQNQNQLLNMLMGNNQGWGNMYQQGQMDMGNLYGGMLGDAANQIGNYNQGAINSRQFDTNTFMQSLPMWMQERARQESERGSGWNAVAGAVGGALPMLAGIGGGGGGGGQQSYYPPRWR